MTQNNCCGGLADNRLEELLDLARERVDPVLLGAGVDKLLSIMQCVGSPAPRLTDKHGKPIRWQDPVIEGEIHSGASVLDRGCGAGSLLEHLMQVKDIRAQGVELDREAVMGCIARGIPVFNADLDAGLAGFADDSWFEVGEVAYGQA